MLKLLGWGALCSLFVLAGCSTMKSGSSASLENRVQTLEARVQTLEGGSQSSSGTVTIAGNELVSSSSSSATVETMSKKEIQKALKNAGYYNGTIDGKIGPKTKEAIKEFQKDMGLKVDGVPGSQTKEKLLKYLQ